MLAGDRETWEYAKASLANFKDAVPEHRNYHRVLEQEDVADVSDDSDTLVFDALLWFL
jgi:hypothetical protein